jgi:hypothetical protein
LGFFRNCPSGGNAKKERKNPERPSQIGLDSEGKMTKVQEVASQQVEAKISLSNATKHFVATAKVASTACLDLVAAGCVGLLIACHIAKPGKRLSKGDALKEFKAALIKGTDFKKSQLYLYLGFADKLATKFAFSGNTPQFGGIVSTIAQADKPEEAMSQVVAHLKRNGVGTLDALKPFLGMKEREPQTTQAQPSAEDRTGQAETATETPKAETATATAPGVPEADSLPQTAIVDRINRDPAVFRSMQSVAIVANLKKAEMLIGVMRAACEMLETPTDCIELIAMIQKRHNELAASIRTVEEAGSVVAEKASRSGKRDAAASQ